MADAVKVNEADKYFLHFLKYEQCIYIIGITGAVSQVLLSLLIIAHLALGINFPTEVMTTRGITYSYLGIFILIATSFSEILLMRAVNQRILRFIQWWMFSSFLLLLFCLLLSVIIGFTIFQNGLWITIAFIYVILRFPIQMYFVDCFTHVEILHREPCPQNPYQSVLYKRFP